MQCVGCAKELRWSDVFPGNICVDCHRDNNLKAIPPKGKGAEPQKIKKISHKKETFTDRSGTNIMCTNCDEIVKHPTKTDRAGNPIQSWQIGRAHV